MMHLSRHFATTHAYDESKNYLCFIIELIEIMDLPTLVYPIFPANELNETDRTYSTS